MAKLRAAIAKDIPAILAAMAKKAKEGDATAARLLLERAVPPLRPTDQPEALSLPGETLTEQGNGVMAAIASGELSASQGAQLMTALGSLAKLAQEDELRRRIEALEDAQKRGRS